MNLLYPLLSQSTHSLSTLQIMGLSYRDSIAAAEIAFYSPALLVGVYLTAIHPFHSTGWVDIVLFSIIRIVGSVVQLETINHPTLSKLYTIATIMNSIGLAPLLAGSIGLLNRLNENIRKNKSSYIHANIFRVVQIGIILGLIFGVIGGVKSGKSIGQTSMFTVGAFGKAGTALLATGFAADLILIHLTARHISHVDIHLRRLLFAVLAVTPFLAVRLVYSILATLTTDHDFNFLTGRVADWLCMAVLQEAAIIIIYMFIGLTLKRPPQNEREVAEIEQPRTIRRFVASVLGMTIIGTIFNASRKLKKDGR